MADFLVHNNFLMSTATAGGTEAVDVYEAEGVFSINASNQLRGTFWAKKNGQSVINNLGTASYTVRDVDGSTVGITQSGISADANGLYKITAVSAASILDLTHYTVHVSVSVDSQAVTAILPVTVGE